VLQFAAIQRKDTKEWAIPGVHQYIIYNILAKLKYNSECCLGNV
jgi:hypothetical protein